MLGRGGGCWDRVGVLGQGGGVLWWGGGCCGGVGVVVAGWGVLWRGVVAGWVGLTVALALLQLQMEARALGRR